MPVNANILLYLQRLKRFLMQVHSLLLYPSSLVMSPHAVSDGLASGCKQSSHLLTAEILKISLLESFLFYGRVS